METQNKSRNTAIINLPKEIIEEEILPRLAVKSLLRFRCVSKSWRSLIGSEKFIKTQFQNSEQRVILHNPDDLPKQCSLQSLLGEKPIDPSPLYVPAIASSSLQVLGSYNGLVCIKECPSEFWLWNPSTRISKKLPEICNERSHVASCGFGWDESSGEYKVFALLFDGYRSCSGRVYSSKTKSWKTIEYNFADLPYCWDEFRVFVGGRLYWRNFRANDIIFFDLKSEVFGRIKLPFDDQVNRRLARLGQIGGCFCVLHWKECVGRDGRVWVIKKSWEMKKYWERLVDLSFDHELLQRPLSSSFTYKGSNGEIFLFHGSTFLVYDPRDNVFRFHEVRRQFPSHHVYVESLLSPDDVLGTA